MMRGLWSAKRRGSQPNEAASDKGSLPPGQRVYVFGDVHGRADLLRSALDWVKGELKKASIEEARLIGLGDYVDRGPESAAVLDLLAEASSSGFARTTFLKGNHEQLLLDFLDHPARVGPGWMQLGGWETLMSYGVDCTPHNQSASELRRARDDLVRRLPPRHLALLQGLVTSEEIGGYFFVHAGVRSGVPLHRQAEHDLLWIRPEPYEPESDFGKVVVHGHTPVAQSFVGPSEINLDTGAYATGRLSCAVLEGDSCRLVEVSLQKGIVE